MDWGTKILSEALPGNNFLVTGPIGNFFRFEKDTSVALIAGGIGLAPMINSARKLRGQGDFFGTKQSGVPNLYFADIIRDIKIIKNVKYDVENIIVEDEELILEKNMVIKERLMSMYNDSTSYFGIG